MANTVYVLNGPNLNLLGTREPETYGRATIADVERLCREAAARHKLAVEFRQSNHEVHISNIFARESFRHHSHIAPVAKASLCGFGVGGYALAIDGLAALIGAHPKMR
jgi:3-dehydroquinate dehydratase II